MITVGYSTRKSNPQYKSIIQKTCMHKEIEIIEKVNNGEKSLSEVYNEILNESNNDIVVLCHDDLEFDTKRWGDKLIKLFENYSDFGIIGLAGTTHMPKSGMWWEDRSKMIGIVNHKHQGKKWESRYYPSLEDKLKKVVVVDGLFIAINKKNIKENFDVNVPGFHMYDVNFCFNNFLKGVKIGVTTLVRVTHLSIGATNEQWGKNRVIFSEKFKDQLPSKVNLETEDSLKVLLMTDNLQTEDNQIFKIGKSLNKIHDINLLYNTSNKEMKVSCKKNNILSYNFKELPGIKIGDGRWQIVQNGTYHNSIVGELYNLKNLTYDIIVSDSVKFVEMFKTVFSKTPKFLLTDNNIKTHDTVKILKNTDGVDFNKLLIDELNSNPNKKNKIKIVSGYSDKGGSTTAFINLTNYLNQSNLDCTFYGPNNWHLDKCQSDLLKNLTLEPDDVVLFHFINLPSRPNVKKSIFVCHEKWWWSFENKNKFFDTCVFLHQEHRNFHKEYVGNFEIIPNLKENLISKEKSNLNKIAGVIGSIEDRKQTHISIQRALEDGCEKIYLYGRISDENYYNNFVKPLMVRDKIELKGYSENKQEMYDSIGRVYHSSKGEVACLIKDECWLTNTEFFGNEETENEVSKLNNEEILNLWRKIFNID